MGTFAVVLIFAILYSAIGFFLAGWFEFDEDDGHIAVLALAWPVMLLIGLWFVFYDLGSRIRKKLKESKNE